VGGGEGVADARHPEVRQSGHNGLGHLPSRGDTDDDLASQISFGVPTATAVIIDVPGTWADLEPKSARIREIFTARKRD